LNLTPKRNSKYLLGMSKLGYVNYVWRNNFYFTASI
jgi:hypothetical protein